MMADLDWQKIEEAAKRFERESQEAARRLEEQRQANQKK
jgi:ActR/RegA family two-component response regulator